MIVEEKIASSLRTALQEIDYVLRQGENGWLEEKDYQRLLKAKSKVEKVLKRFKQW